MSQRLRITGLVRVADAVRRELAQPMTAEQIAKVRSRTERHLRDIDGILARHAARDSSLPAPSRRAVGFLRGIQWGQIRPSETAAAPAATAETVRFNGLSQRVDRFARRLTEPLTDLEAQDIRASLELVGRQLDSSLKRLSVGPDRLVASARALRGWVSFFALADNFQAHRAAQAVARGPLESAAARAKIRLPLQIEFRPMKGIYHYRSSFAHGTRVTLPIPMITFDGATFEVLGRFMFDGDKLARRRVIEAMQTEAYQTVQAEFEAIAGVPERTRGAFHDLAERFDRVNESYFGGAMPRPRLTWSRSFTGRKFGHYDHIHDTVMVSASLDAPGVPVFVVDYLLFHELLHKKHGVAWRNGRGYHHTRAFYDDERRFPQYERADEILSRIALGKPLDALSTTHPVT